MQFIEADAAAWAPPANHLVDAVKYPGSHILYSNNFLFKNSVPPGLESRIISRYLDSYPEHCKLLTTGQIYQHSLASSHPHGERFDIVWNKDGHESEFDNTWGGGGVELGSRWGAGEEGVSGLLWVIF